MNKERKKILEDLKRYANEGKGHLLLDFEIRHILAHINQLQQKNQQLKKQKDDVVEALKTLKYRSLYEEDFYVEDDGIDELLRMLGEIDD